MPNETITIDDFTRVDLRAGRVIAVEPFAKARNPSWKVQVDLGELGTKWSSAQITNYTAEELIGRLVICVCNFPPRNIAGFQSEVLILGVPDSDGKIILLTPQKAGLPPDAIGPGAKVY
ncbi:MAG: tRNA-binding protein [Proteobacteria bacterium SG_bin9]|nr:MAG: tRNA-binding protein [Proteobacteria bacterium SG_bin9]